MRKIGKQYCILKIYDTVRYRKKRYVKRSFTRVSKCRVSCIRVLAAIIVVYVFSCINKVLYFSCMYFRVSIPVYIL